MLRKVMFLFKTSLACTAVLLFSFGSLATESSDTRIIQWKQIVSERLNYALRLRGLSENDDKAKLEILEKIQRENRRTVRTKDLLSAMLNFSSFSLFVPEELNVPADWLMAYEFLRANFKPDEYRHSHKESLDGIALYYLQDQIEMANKSDQEEMKTPLIGNCRKLLSNVPDEAIIEILKERGYSVEKR